tara:strand:- start:1477 stop:1767 length:291 start_codon:yes stop_codon:yes gene_type:complete
MDFTNEVQNVENAPVEKTEDVDELQAMANEIAQEDSEEILSEEGTEDVEEPEVVEKGGLFGLDMNNMMLLGLAILLIAFFFRKEIQEFFAPKSSSD